MNLKNLFSKKTGGNIPAPRVEPTIPSEWQVERACPSAYMERDSTDEITKIPESSRDKIEMAGYDLGDDVLRHERRTLLPVPEGHEWVVVSKTQHGYKIMTHNTSHETTDIYVALAALASFYGVDLEST